MHDWICVNWFYCEVYVQERWTWIFHKIFVTYKLFKQKLFCAQLFHTYRVGASKLRSAIFPFSPFSSVRFFSFSMLNIIYQWQVFEFQVCTIQIFSQPYKVKGVNIDTLKWALEKERWKWRKKNDHESEHKEKWNNLKNTFCGKKFFRLVFRTPSINICFQC